MLALPNSRPRLLLSVPLVLLVLAQNVVGQFLYPETNETLTEGTLVRIRCEPLVFGNLTVKLWQQSPRGQNIGLVGPTLYDVTNGTISTFDWAVQTYDFNLADSDTFTLRMTAFSDEVMQDLPAGTEAEKVKRLIYQPEPRYFKIRAAAYPSLTFSTTVNGQPFITTVQGTPISPLQTNSPGGDSPGDGGGGSSSSNGNSKSNNPGGGGGGSTNSNSSNNTTTSTTNSVDGGSNTGLSTSAAVGLGVGGVIGGLAIAVAVVLFFMRCRSTKKKTVVKQAKRSDDSGSSLEVMERAEVAGHRWPTAPYSTAGRSELMSAYAPGREMVHQLSADRGPAEFT